MTKEVPQAKQVYILIVLSKGPDKLSLFFVGVTVPPSQIEIESFKFC